MPFSWRHTLSVLPAIVSLTFINSLAHSQTHCSDLSHKYQFNCNVATIASQISKAEMDTPQLPDISATSITNELQAFAYKAKNAQLLALTYHPHDLSQLYHGELLKELKQLRPSINCLFSLTQPHSSVLFMQDPPTPTISNLRRYFVNNAATNLGIPIHDTKRLSGQSAYILQTDDINSITKHLSNGDCETGIVFIQQTSPDNPQRFFPENDVQVVTLYIKNRGYRLEDPGFTELISPNPTDLHIIAVPKKPIRRANAYDATVSIPPLNQLYVDFIAFLDWTTPNEGVAASIIY